MFCKNCGKELLDGAAFCSACGTAVTSPIAEDTKAENTCDNSEEKVMFDTPEVNNESTAPIYQMPQYTAPTEENVNDKKGFSLASLILGICSLLPCCCVNSVLSILAIVFGIIGIKSTNKTQSIVGIILASASLLIYLVIIVVYVIIMGEFSIYDEFMYY